MPEQTPALNLEADAIHAYLRLTLAAEHAQEHIQRMLRPYGLTPGQIAVLQLLYREGPLQHGQIGPAVSRSSGNVTTVVDNLVRRGLVTRERSNQDRRVVHVNLTELGRETTSKILPGYSGEVQEIMRGLDRDQLSALSMLCDQLVHAECEMKVARAG